MKYELTFLLNDKEELNNIKNLIESFKGSIKKDEDWGEKTLSYPIKNNQKARFYNYLIEIDRSKIMELRKKLSFNEKLIRYLLIVKE